MWELIHFVKGTNGLIFLEPAFLTTLRLFDGYLDKYLFFTTKN
ncbi:hypothetical protein [Leptospira noguchii]|nr:hypothetical protein [Leptospira noguchii]